MTQPTSDVAFTPAVKAQQELRGSRAAYAGMEQKGGWTDHITDDLAAFIAARDSFYLGTASADGQPYIQHRGGQPGFLKVIDGKTLAFPDYGGNQQYISVGNLSENNKAYLFLMDYPNRRRIKIWGRARIIEGDADLNARLTEAPGAPVPERVVLFEVTAWDRNCPQFITPRFDATEIEVLTAPLHARIIELEAEIAATSATCDAPSP